MDSGAKTTPIEDEKPSTRRIKLPYTRRLHRLMRPILRTTGRLLFHALCRVRITGVENLPERGGYLIASNHISLFEPPFLLSFWPATIEAAGAKEIWERPVQNVLVRLYGAIPVHRGVYDRQMIDAALAVLKSGRSLLLMPEGGRSHDLGMRQALPGIAYIVDLAGVPVVPVGIAGTTDDFLKKALRGKRPLLEMRIGRSFRLPPIAGKGKDRRLERQQHADRIMEEIAALLPEEYHGIYGKPPAQAGH